MWEVLGENTIHDGVEVLVGFIKSFMDLLTKRGLSWGGSLLGGGLSMSSISWGSEKLLLNSVSKEVSLDELGELGGSTRFLINLPLESQILHIKLVLTQIKENKGKQRQIKRKLS